jgi:divalent metal cation (Fe/Co/Zn/Cd) transporter
MATTRKQNLKEARTLQIWNVIYDVIEVIVSLIAGFTANSSALIGWGLDSTIEVITAGTLGWRLHGEIKGLDEKRVEQRKTTTLYVIAISFTLICIFISYDSITKLISQETASWSTVGIVILIVSLGVNPFLIYYKRKYGNKLESPALLADAKDTFICLYQTVVVLIGLLLMKWLGWWWADPVAALLIVPYAAKEGWDAFSKAQKIKKQHT